MYASMSGGLWRLIPRTYCYSAPLKTRKGWPYLLIFLATGIAERDGGGGSQSCPRNGVFLGRGQGREDERDVLFCPLYFIIFFHATPRFLFKCGWLIT